MDRIILLAPLLAVRFHEIICIWPPPYAINLSHSEDFVIFETFGSDEGDDIYSDEDEMIKKVDVRSFSIEKDKDKYFRIHKLAMKRKYLSNIATTRKPRYIKWAEFNYEKEESVPWAGGFFAENRSSALKENSNVYYLNEMAKGVVESKIYEKREKEFTASIKRKQKSAEKAIDYNYDAFKAEYMVDVKDAKLSNLTLDFIEVKEEESIKDAFENIVNIRTSSRNCTKEEIKGIGLAAVECFWIDLRKNSTEEQRKKLGKGVVKILLVWFALYLIIAIPCWCQKGWCCCCFQCRFCKPQRRIDEAKKYVADNPPGTYTEQGEVIKYEPTHYEKYAQKRLEQALMKL